MCYSPVLIKNPRLDFRPEFDKVSVMVPCGHCLECIEQKKDDWFVRLYYEFKRNRDRNGKNTGVCLFPTFTYENDNLPTLDTNLPEFGLLDRWGDYPLVKDVQVFDKSAVQSMVKKLRIYLQRDYELGKDIKYFIACEKGDEKDRPHYHALFFFPFNISADLAKDYFERAWSYEISYKDDDGNPLPEFHNILKDAAVYFHANPKHDFYNPSNRKEYKHLVRKDKYGKFHILRKRGFVSYSQDFGPFVKNSDSCGYVTKYIQKPKHFMRQEEIKQILEFLHDCPKLSTLEKSDPCYEALAKLYNIFPFHLQSKGLGASLADELLSDYKTLLKRKQTLSLVAFGKVAIDGKSQLYNIPQYVINRIMYTNEDTYRQYNDTLSGSSLGDPIDFNLSDVSPNLQVDFLRTYRAPHAYQVITYCDQRKKRMLTEFGKEVLQVAQDLKITRLERSFRLFSSDVFLHDVITHCTDTEEIQRLKMSRPKMSVNADWELLALYKLHLQGVSTWRFDMLDIALNQSKDFFKKTLRDFGYAKIRSYNDISSNGVSPLQNKDVMEKLTKKYPLFNDIPFFEGFDAYIAWCNEVRCALSKLSNISKVNKQETAKAVKLFYQSLIY